MAPRDKPPGPNIDVFWFTAQADTIHGPFIDPSDLGINSPDNERLGFFPVGLFPKNPTAKFIKEKLFGAGRYHKVDLYLTPRAIAPVLDGHKVDLDKYGLTKNNHILFVDKNHDKTESKDVQDERDVESVDRQMKEDAKYKTFTKRLKNITHGDWSIYPEAIKTIEGDILWTDGHSNHSFASAPTIQAYKVVRRYQNNRNGSVIDHGLASASPYYFELLD